MKKTYTAPALISKGRVEQLTHASSVVSAHTDAAFGSNTPFSSLTFT